MAAPSASRPLKHFYEVPRDLLSRKGVETRKHVHGLTGTLIIGDDTGLIKVISCKKKKVIKLWGEQNPIKKIQKLYWAHPPITNGHNTDISQCIPMKDVYNAQKEFLAVLSNGDIRLFNSLVGTYTTPIKQESNVKGMNECHKFD